MSEADRVFARMTTPGAHPEPAGTQIVHITTRRRGTVASQTRTVEVVHRRPDRVAASSTSADPPEQSAHAATWPDGFLARPVPAALPVDNPVTTPASSPPVGHVMPGWEPLLPPLTPAAAPEPPPPHQARPRASKLTRSRAVERSFADPFAAEDAGANCRRCGYRVQPGRERRGLTTCASCG